LQEYSVRQLQAMEKKQVEVGLDFSHLCVLSNCIVPLPDVLMFCRSFWELLFIIQNISMPERITNIIQYRQDYLTRIFWLTSAPISSMIISEE